MNALFLVAIFILLMANDRLHARQLFAVAVQAVVISLYIFNTFQDLQKTKLKTNSINKMIPE